MFDCPNCNNHLPDGATFCSQCWQEVSDPPGDAPTTVLPGEGATTPWQSPPDPTLVQPAWPDQGPDVGGPASPPSTPSGPSYGPPPSGPSYGPPLSGPSYGPPPAASPYGPPPSASPSYAPPPTYQPAPPPPGVRGPAAYPAYPPPPSYSPQAAYGGAYPMAPGWGYPVTRTNGMAIASLVLGIIGLPFCAIPSIAAVVFGHIAIYQINRSAGAEQGKGMAIAGLVLGYLVLLGFTAFLVAAAMSGP